MELERRFADDEACRQYLFALRWPQGFACSACGGKDVWKGSRNRLLCTSCRRQIYILAGTVLQDSHLPLTLWFRAMWHLTSQKNGISALGLQRELGIGSYKTAWTLLHKLRRAMVRPGRERLRGAVEVDEAYWGAPEEGAVGRLTDDKALIAVAVEEDRDGIGRIRLHRIPNLTRATLLNPLSRAASCERMGCQPISIWSAMFMIERCSGISRKANTCCLAPTVSSPFSSDG